MNSCPQCQSSKIIKSGVIKERQRYKCKQCNYNFTVNKLGKQIDQYYVTKALQLYLEGLSYREIERILGVSHVTIMKWVRKYRVKQAFQNDYHPTYKICNSEELANFFKKQENLKGAGVIVTELGNKFMLIKWERFKD
jgi:DNA-directed RNA polymerase subunit M/transcription elongation factor TFIIS